MGSPPYAEELRAAVAAVRQAAAVCRAVQRGISRDAVEKKDKSPVTVADFASQAIVCRTLHAAFPNDPIIGEEDASELRGAAMAPFREQIVAELSRIGLESSGDDVCDWIDRGRASDPRDRFWTLDPIDGTKGFLRGEQYAVSLALIVEGQIVMGLLACPNLLVDRAASDASRTAADVGALFVAVRGAGAHVASLDEAVGTKRPVRVSATTDAAQARLCESVESGHSAHDSGLAVSPFAWTVRPSMPLSPTDVPISIFGCRRARIMLKRFGITPAVCSLWKKRGEPSPTSMGGGSSSPMDGGFAPTAASSSPTVISTPPCSMP
jgi:3'(2'), 5'-bisphosphate nucleotidase